MAPLIPEPRKTTIISCKALGPKPARSMIHRSVTPARRTNPETHFLDLFIAGRGTAPPMKEPLKATVVKTRGGLRVVMTPEQGNGQFMHKYKQELVEAMDRLVTDHTRTVPASRRYPPIRLGELVLEYVRRSA